MVSGMMISQEWFRQSPDIVARSLIGATLFSVNEQGHEQAVVITETEAYWGKTDGACHTWKGISPAAKVLHGEAGRFSVHRSYGIWTMTNITAGDEGECGSVLLRAAKPVGGIYRSMVGPGMLSAALGIDETWNGRSAFGPVRIVLPTIPPSIVTSPRIGIPSKAGADWQSVPLRFFDAESPEFVSKPRRPFKKAA